MFGLVGSGRTEVAKAIFGAEPADRGEIRVDGRDGRIRNAGRRRSRSGIADVTEDRKRDGLALDLSVLDNAGLASYGPRLAARLPRPACARTRLVDGKIGELSDPAEAERDRAVRQLSGGNQQKVVLAKWLLVDEHPGLHLRRADARRRHRAPRSRSTA